MRQITRAVVLVLALTALPSSASFAEMGLLGVEAPTTAPQAEVAPVEALAPAPAPAEAYVDNPPRSRIDLRRSKLHEWIQAHGIVRRSAWSTEVLYPTDMEYDWDYDTVVIHHSGNYGVNDPQKILEMHINKNGWADIGYHFLIQADGTVYEGRPLLYKGSHVKDANTHKIGIILMGNFQPHWWNVLGTDPIHAAQETAAENLVRALKRFFPTLKRLGGHRDFILDPNDVKRDCPGDNLYRLLPDLREATGLTGP